MSTFVNGVLNVAVSEQYTVSKSAKVVQPIPMAGPLTAAKIGFGKLMNPATMASKEMEPKSALKLSLTKLAKSKPLEKYFPAPVTNTALIFELSASVCKKQGILSF